MNEIIIIIMLAFGSVDYPENIEGCAAWYQTPTAEAKTKFKKNKCSNALTKNYILNVKKGKSDILLNTQK